MTRPVGPEGLGAEAFVVRMREEGAERDAAGAAGVEIAHDGMELEL